MKESTKLSLLLLFTTLWTQGACTTVIIHNENEFVDVAENVTKYNGATLVLDADLDLSGVQNYVPIGKSSYYAFHGVFDGQGHTIKNMNLSTFYSNAGLLGYTSGIRVKNIVLDSSCKIN